MEKFVKTTNIVLIILIMFTFLLAPLSNFGYFLNYINIPYCEELYLLNYEDEFFVKPYEYNYSNLFECYRTEINFLGNSYLIEKNYNIINSACRLKSNKKIFCFNITEKGEFLDWQGKIIKN